jgi:pyrimidine-nucleoside phosphorylase
MSTVELIAKKRDGGTLSDVEIRSLIDGYVDGQVTDYQMSALAMAVFFQGMEPAETAALTLAMRDSGQVLDLSSVPGVKVDKHSTGGVGDKVSLCLAPLMAAVGVPVPMISGRGLGHTGGTLDKLEAIPGFRVDLTIDELVRQVGDVGCALVGQTADLAPADKRLYALRDVTATVESVPLITASILSKKLAEGIDALVLDVKVGRGAFMKSQEQARRLARSLVRVGGLAGKRVSALLTTMDAPLGRTVGNALETAEAIGLLHGEAPADLLDCTMVLGSEMLRLAGLETKRSAAQKRLARAIEDGSALAKMKDIVQAQGGDPRVVDEPDRLPSAPVTSNVKATEDGFVTGVDALELGWSSVALGAGRRKVEDAVDPAVGIFLHKKPGDAVRKGERLATLHVRSRQDADRVRNRVRDAFVVRKQRSDPQPLLLETIRK